MRTTTPDVGINDTYTKKLNHLLTVAPCVQSDGRAGRRWWTAAQCCRAFCHGTQFWCRRRVTNAVNSANCTTAWSGHDLAVRSLPTLLSTPSAVKLSEEERELSSRSEWEQNRSELPIPRVLCPVSAPPPAEQRPACSQPCQAAIPAGSRTISEQPLA